MTNWYVNAISSVVTSARLCAVHGVTHEQRIDGKQRRRCQRRTFSAGQGEGQQIKPDGSRRSNQSLRDLHQQRPIAEEPAHRGEKQRIQRLEQRGPDAAARERSVVEQTGGGIPVVDREFRSRHRDVEQTHDRGESPEQ